MAITNFCSRHAAADPTTVLIQLVLDRSSDTPLNRQLYLLLRELILSARLAGETRLPSTRQLAIDLGVSRTVTLAAYDQLAAEGYVSAKRGSGQYVQAFERKPAGPIRAESGDAEPVATSAASSARGKPFDPVAPAWELFPARVWSRLIASSWRREGEAAAAFDHWGGLPSLRAAVAEHLRAMQGLDCAADQIAITNGNDDALQLIIRALDLAGEEAWIEDPGHVSSRSSLSRLGLRVRPIRVDGEGVDVAAGRQLVPAARLALVTPSRQFPLGMPLSLSRRLALIDWSRESGAIIIEDDYDSELRFSGRPMTSLLGLDPTGSVLAVGSFSKLTFPGLRLGYVVGPGRLIARLVSERERQGVLVATSAQPALAAFISDGGFAKHLGVLRRTIAQRRAVLIDAVQTHLSGRVAILPQEVGMHLTVLLHDSSPGSETDKSLAARAAERGINVEPLSAHAMSAGGREGFLLGYAAWDDQALVHGVEALARLMNR